MISGVSKKRKRKSQGPGSKGEGREREATAEEENEEPEEEESMDVQMVARTMEEKQKEQDQKNLLVRHLDPDQFARYEAWRVSKFSDAVVRRVCSPPLFPSLLGNWS